MRFTFLLIPFLFSSFQNDLSNYNFMDKTKQEALLDAHSKYTKLKNFYDQHQDVLKDKIPTDALNWRD